MAVTQTVADSRPETARPARVSRETSRLLPIVAPVVFGGTLVCVLALAAMAAYEPSAATLAGIVALLLASTFVEAFPVPIENVPVGEHLSPRSSSSAPGSSTAGRPRSWSASSPSSSSR